MAEYYTQLDEHGQPLARFGAKRVGLRNEDEFMGICKGLTADRVLNQKDDPITTFALSLTKISIPILHIILPSPIPQPTSKTPIFDSITLSLPSRSTPLTYQENQYHSAFTASSSLFSHTLSLHISFRIHEAITR